MESSPRKPIPPHARAGGGTGANAGRESDIPPRARGWRERARHDCGRAAAPPMRARVEGISARAMGLLSRPPPRARGWREPGLDLIGRPLVPPTRARGGQFPNAPDRITTIPPCARGWTEVIQTREVKSHPPTRAREDVMRAYVGPTSCPPRAGGRCEMHSARDTGFQRLQVTGRGDPLHV